MELSIKLRRATDDDIPQIRQWFSDKQYVGEYQCPKTRSGEYFRKIIRDHIFFIIEKDKVKIGHINGWHEDSMTKDTKKWVLHWFRMQEEKVTPLKLFGK